MHRPNERERLRSLLTPELLTGDLELDPIHWKVADLRAEKFILMATNSGLVDLGRIVTFERFETAERLLDQVGEAIEEINRQQLGTPELEATIANGEAEALNVC